MMSNNFMFTQLLQSVRYSGLFVTNQPHFTESSHTKNTKLNEILKTNSFVQRCTLHA